MNEIKIPTMGKSKGELLEIAELVHKVPDEVFPILTHLSDSIMHYRNIITELNQELNELDELAKCHKRYADQYYARILELKKEIKELKNEND